MREGEAIFDAKLNALRRIAGLPADDARGQRMEKVQRLIEQGATQGEREAAEAAMHRMRMDRLDSEVDDFSPL